MGELCPFLGMTGDLYGQNSPKMIHFRSLIYYRFLGVMMELVNFQEWSDSFYDA